MSKYSRHSDSSHNLLSASKIKLGDGMQDLSAVSHSSSFVGMEPSEASLNLLSAIVGGGMLGLPFAMYHCGLIAGIIIQISISWFTMQTIYVLFLAKDLTPGQPESYYEIGYMVLGRRSIYLNAVLIGIYSFGLMMIYFIVFADITRSLVRQLLLDPDY